MLNSRLSVILKKINSLGSVDEGLENLCEFAVENQRRGLTSSLKQMSPSARDLLSAKIAELGVRFDAASAQNAALDVSQLFPFHHDRMETSAHHAQTRDLRAKLPTADGMRPASFVVQRNGRPGRVSGRTGSFFALDNTYFTETHRFPDPS